MVAESCFFFCPNSLRWMYAETYQNIITWYWFRKPEELIDDFDSEQWASLLLALCSVLHVWQRCSIWGGKSLHFPLLLIIVIPNPLQNAHIRIRLLSLILFHEGVAGPGAGASAIAWIKQSPPASLMNKYTDMSLNMPKGSYHIQLSRGCWYIIQVLCSHSDTLTCPNKSLICLNELDVCGFCAGIYKGEFPYYKKKCHFPFTHVDMVCGFGVHSLIEGRFNEDRHIMASCCQSLFISPNRADFYRYPITHFYFSLNTNCDLFPSPAT